MDKVFQVYLARQDAPDSESYASLALPAQPWELLDALDKVRLAGDETLYLEIEDYYDYEELVPHLADEAISLYELNALAHQLSELDEIQHTAFSGLLQMEVNKRTGPISIQTFRDLAASVDCCHVVESVINDQQLGRFYAENGFLPELDELPESVFELMDFEAIGKRNRIGESGVFIPSGRVDLGGYVVQSSELKKAPPVPSEIPVPDYSILLRVSKGWTPNDSKTVLLKLPAGPEQIDFAAKELGAASWEELGWRCLDCRIPTLSDVITDAGDLPTVHFLARTLMDMEQKYLPVYKALLAATDCPDIRQALLCADGLDQYILSPGISGPRELAREEVRMMASEQEAELLLKHLNLYAYGEELLKQGRATLTEYGLLERQDGQPILRLTDQPTQGGMRMR